MKKILFVLPYYKIGGTLTSFTNLIPLIDKTKYEIDVFALANEVDDLSILPTGVNYLGLNFSDLHSTSMTPSFKNRMLKFLKYGKRILTKFGYDPSDAIFKKMAKTLSDKYDIVIAFQEGQPTRMAQFIDAPVKIAWIHSMFSRFEKMPSVNDAIRAYDNYNRIVCVSKTAAMDMTTCNQSYSDKIRVVYNAIDIRKLEVLSNNDVLTGNGFNIVSIGRIDPVKRFSYIPQIASVLKNKGIKFDWWIIGGKTVETEWNLLCSNIERYQVSDCVHMLGAQPNPYPYIRKSDMLVCLSSSETFNYTIAEAKALCKLVVTTDFPCAFEFVEDGVTGLISPMDEIPHKIESLLTDKSLYDSISSNLVGLKALQPVTKEQFDNLLGSL